jgi:hypothetical protein
LRLSDPRVAERSRKLAPMQVWPARTIRLHLGVGVALAGVGLLGVALATWSWF